MIGSRAERILNILAFVVRSARVKMFGCAIVAERIGTDHR